MIPDQIDFPGTVINAEPVADRRGSRVWKVTLEDGRVLALKYSAGLLAAREANVLRHIDHNGYLHAAGETEDGSWIAVSWVEGPTLAQHWREVSTSDNPNHRAAALAAAWLAADTLADLHGAGWRHADLQAVHILIPDTGRAQLIDFALAQGPVQIDPAVTYRGALAHLAAPEIAAEFLATPADHHINLTTDAEVYTFGAVLFTVWTKQWPFDYSTDPRRLTTEQIYQRIGEPERRRPMPGGWTAMADLIAGMLADDPADRPTMAQVRASLFRCGAGKSGLDLAVEGQVHGQDR